jgi:hypothetical protein
MSQSDVIAAGYPPRPDPDSPRYERWLELVSTPVTLIDVHAVQTNRHRGPAKAMSSTNYAGIALDYPGSAPYTTYTDAGSWMFVPDLSQQGSGSIASPWIGLGGVHDSVIIQQGVEGFSSGGVTMYFAWYEYYPDGLLMLDTNVNPNDLVYMEAYECDQSWNSGRSHQISHEIDRLCDGLGKQV